MSLFGSILGAVVPKLVGGIFGKSKPQTNTVDYARMVKDAQAAGFNPLTALRNGGSAGFTVTNPALSSKEFISDALSDGFNAALGYKQDEMDKEREKIQIDLMKEELAQMKRRGKLYSQGNYGFGAPSATVYTGEHENYPQRPRLSSRPLGDVDGARPSGDQSDVTDYVVGGTAVEGNPDFSDAQTMEDRHGDIIGSVWGLVTAPADWYQHYGKKTQADISDIPKKEKRVRVNRRTLRPKLRPLPYRSSTLTSAF